MAVCGGPPPDLAGACTIEKGHGRIETRELAASSELAGSLDWPGLAQVGRIHRIHEIGSKISGETIYVISSLAHEQASPEMLLALNRQNWSIESVLQAHTERSSR